MKLHHASTFLFSSLLLSACTILPKNPCDSDICQKLAGSNNARVDIWWSPALRDSSGEYSTVPLND
ncbi:hypothetical protein [Pseudomonas chlororaphis]|uniref:hypothetical protein n=1 Tax=Pseudomonas chlororaphis TaxID=587753 RepID=UPI000F586E56|nr:hypothetical protein [Pseudomonas chlororaphis]